MGKFVEHRCTACDSDWYRLLIEGTAECLDCYTIFDVSEDSAATGRVDEIRPKVRKLRKHEYDDER